MTEQEPGRERVADVYVAEDYPVLLAVARIELDEGPTVILSHDLARRIDRPDDAVRRSLVRLFRGGMVEGEDKAFMGGGGFFLVRGLTERGLREVGAWPREESLAAGLRHILEAEASKLQLSEPQKAGKVRAILDELEDLGTSFTAKLSAELIKWMATGG
jgi:hypothetical protein